MAYPSSSSFDKNRILSIQSHVVSGYVGNRAATFPLQLLGYDVDVVNTVHFSNHTGYGHTNGHKTTPEQLQAIFSGLQTNGIGKWGRLLTGYIPGASALKVVDEEVRKVRKRERDEKVLSGRVGDDEVVYLLDPVMGDIGKGLYVAEDVVPIYRGMLEIATMVTPNAFELEILSQTKISSLVTLQSALRILHSSPNSVPHIAVSSIILPSHLVRRLQLPPPPTAYTSLLEGKDGRDVILPTTEGDGDDEVLVCFASSSVNPEKDELETYAFALPTVQGYYSGVGDLFSALVLGYYQKDGRRSLPNGQPGKDDLPPFPRAVSLALLAVQQVLLQTHLSTMTVHPANVIAHHHAPQSPEEDCLPTDEDLDSLPAGFGNAPLITRLARRSRKRELRLIQERRLLMDVEERYFRGEAGWPCRRVEWTEVDEEETKL